MDNCRTVLLTDEKAVDNKGKYFNDDRRIDYEQWKANNFKNYVSV